MERYRLFDSLWINAGENLLGMEGLRVKKIRGQMSESLVLGLLLAVCLAAQSLGGVWMAVLGAAAFAVGLIPALLWNRHLRRRPMEYRITGRVD